MKWPRLIALLFVLAQFVLTGFLISRVPEFAVLASIITFSTASMVCLDIGKEADNGRP